MTKPSIEKPFKLTWHFWVCMAMVSIPIFVFWPPWEDTAMPLISIIASCVALPFFATLFIYCPVVFIKRAMESGDRGIFMLKLLSFVIFGNLLVLAAIYYLGYIELVRSWIVLPLVVCSLLAIYHFSDSKKSG